MRRVELELDCPHALYTPDAYYWGWGVEAFFCGVPENDAALMVQVPFRTFVRQGYHYMAARMERLHALNT